MNRFCLSCAAPLQNPEMQGPTEDYCKYCTDEQGHLKTRMQVQQGLAQWFISWQPDVNEAVALARAGEYMKAMPAWAK